MTHDVTSRFINESGKSTLEVVRRFTIASSDYSGFVVKWPKFKQSHNSIKPVALTVTLANEERDFNFIKDDTILLSSNSKFEMGFKGGNLLNQSEEFSNTSSSWTTTTTISSNTDVSPIGDLTADTITDTFTSAASVTYQRQRGTFDVSRYYSFSMYIKKDSVPRTTRFVRVFMIFFSSSSEVYSVTLDTSTGEFSNSQDLIPFDSGVIDSGDYWRVYITSKSTDLTATDVQIGVNPAAGASSSWVVGLNAIGSAVCWGALLTKSDSLQDYNKTDSSLNVYEEELITIFSGKMERVKYQDGKCAITFVDKFKQLSDRLMGTSDVPVTYSNSNYLPSDIAWYAITSYGGYDTTASSSNVDIDYDSWLTWSNIFSADAVFVNGEFDGKKVSEVLKKIGDYTDSAIFISEDKIQFKRFSITDSNQTFFDHDSIRKMSVSLDSRDVINKMYVAADYDTTSNFWKVTVNNELASSVNSYGLKETTIKDKNLWYVNSGSAANLAQRKTNAFGVPYNKLLVETTLKGLSRVIGETISVNDMNLNISEAYRIMGQQIDMDSGKLTFSADRSYFSSGFILDSSTLGSSGVLT